MPTLKDVAEASGFSTATVSHVLNGTKKLSPETTEKVLEMVRKMGYQPNNLAKALRRGQTMQVGVLVEDIRGIPVPEIVCGIGDRLREADYKMLLYDLHLMEQLNTRYEDTRFYQKQIEDGFQALESAKVDGLIYVGMQDIPLMYRFKPVDIPLVFAYSHVMQDDCYVTYDNLEASVEMVQYLIGKGHRRIAVISGHPHSHPTTMRMYGYCKAMHDAGISIPEGYIHYGNWEFSSGYEETGKLLELRPRPTAIFAMNDQMAAGSIHAILDHGLRIPEDISVVGFENHALSGFLKPPLTTAELPLAEIGREAADFTLERIKNPALRPEHKALACRLIERKSVR
ncbi:MAG: LacI family DNA-binding transcriptional regulator [Clostridia bacterium]|nr:LacI family DNA-binding transcriptional regulator [Clostridia bacterium]